MHVIRKQTLLLLPDSYKLVLFITSLYEYRMGLGIALPGGGRLLWTCWAPSEKGAAYPFLLFILRVGPCN
jgi:hypothetical protein